MRTSTVECTASSVLGILPDKIKKYLAEGEILSRAEEIRIRVGAPIQIIGAGIEAVSRAPEVTEIDCETIFSLACQHSMYAWEQELKNGYITLPGGCRVGLCGRSFMGDDGTFRRIGNVTYLNIRVPRQHIGAADPIMPYVLDGDRINSLLIVSPPRGGKTTVLRDVARQLSYSESGYRVCVIDERSEIAGGAAGVPQNDLGPHCDVLDGCPKAEGFMLMLRSMAPDVIITDEIGSRADAEAVAEAALCGVSVIASMHGSDFSSVVRRQSTKSMLESKAFRYAVVIERTLTGVRVSSVSELDAP